LLPDDLGEVGFVAPSIPEGHRLRCEDIIQELCRGHKAALQNNLLRVVVRIEALIPRMEILAGPTILFAADTLDYLRQFYFLSGFRKLNGERMALLLQEMEEFEARCAPAV
jgi:hypothetical protein